MTLADWRALVERELKGLPFDQALVDRTDGGVAIDPLYTQAPTLGDAARPERVEAFRICMRHESDATAEDLVADATGGADALWLPLARARAGALAHAELGGCALVLEADRIPSPDDVSTVVADLPPALPVSVATDPIAWRASGRAPLSSLAADVAALGRLAAAVHDPERPTPTLGVSTLPFHDAGADSVDELAIALSTGAAYVEALVAGGLSADHAARAIVLRMAVGRDTFVEMCKLRALRVCWAKVLAAFGAAHAGSALVHAVCSGRTLSVRDPWVNLLRVTTQVFAAVLGGADLVTPNAFDRAFGAASPLGRRVARNTGLVLREECALGKVGDPAGGSYYFDTLTDDLARAAWTRFQELEREGGMAGALASGRLAGRLQAARRDRLARIATRRLPILGVSDFANLDERLPHPAPRTDAPAEGGFPAFRDAEPFEALRVRADELGAPEVVLVVLGSFADSRPRVSFAANLFAAGGIRTREAAPGAAAAFACLCGTDERYAAEAAACARALRASGARRILLAGRPGPLEADLRAAGVDAFVHAGGDAVAVLSGLLASFEERGAP